MSSSALARGKSIVDKRRDIASRDANREIERAFKRCAPIDSGSCR